MQGKRKSHRRWNESFWRETIRCWKTNGKSKAAFCREQTIALSTFCCWHRRLQLNNPGPVFYPVVVSLKQNVAERREQPAPLRVLFAGKPLKMICKYAAIKFNWGASYNPFFGYKNLPVSSSTYKIEPFNIDEQQRIIQVLPEHWKPYFQFAFSSGVRQGEQFALRANDVHWSQGVIAITKALTLDEDGRKVEGKTKNRYSRREIPILPAMRSVLLKQQSICEQLGSEYLFCTTEGNLLNHANLSNRVWRPALERAGIPYRPMIQTRHSFATTALSLGENPLWIANVMGHRDTDMIIRVYAKYVKNAFSRDGNALNDIYCKTIGKEE